MVRPFWDTFAAAAERWPERTATVMQRSAGGEERYSYRELRAQAEAFAQLLRGHGVARGDRVALLGENSAPWSAAWLAVLGLGAAAVPLDRNYSAQQVAGLLRDCGARLLLASARCLRTGQEAAAAAAMPCLPLEFPAQPGPALPPGLAGAGDVALILYTSGTTSDPKGVMLTHANLAAAVEAFNQAVRLDENDSSLGLIPFFHILGQISGLLLPFTFGGSAVLLEEVNSAEVLRATRERGITVLCAVPQFFLLIHDRLAGELRKRGGAGQAVAGALLNLSGWARRSLGLNPGRKLFAKAHEAVGPRLRFMVSAGAPMEAAAEALLYRFGFTMLQAYGLTETTGAVTFVHPGRERFGTTGQPFGGAQIRILSPEGEAVACGVEGEVFIKGPTVMAGYYNRPDASAAALRDGWFRSGDLGRLDGDGYLAIVGRSKDVIVLASGKKIHPEDVERVLERSALFKELCVLGRKAPSGAETLHAIVVPEMAAVQAQGITNLERAFRHEIDTLSAALPASHRVLSLSIRRAELPRTSTRKLKRHVLARELAAEAQRDPAAPRAWSDADLAWGGQPALAPVLVALRRQAAREDLHPDDHLELDLGLDSLGRIEFLLGVERALGVKLAESAMLKCFTVRDLAEALAAAAPAAPGEAAAGGRDEWPRLLDLARDDAANPEVAALRPTGPLLDAARRLFLLAVRGAARLLFGLRPEGLELLPGDGPCIVAINHQSHLDGFLVMCALPYRHAQHMVMLGKTELVGRGLGGWLAPRFNILAIDADANLRRAMRASARVLALRQSLLLFPEGERSIDGELKPLRRGAAILACHADVPIVPVAIDGTHLVWPRASRPRRLAHVSLRFTAPIRPDGGGDFEQRAAALTEAVHARLEAELRGMRSGAAGAVHKVTQA
jgi:long-chain acyl-CoA synthetase